MENNEQKTVTAEVEVSEELITFASFYAELIGVDLSELSRKVLERGLEEIRSKVQALPFTTIEKLETRLAEGIPATTGITDPYLIRKAQERVNKGEFKSLSDLTRTALTEFLNK